MCWSPDTELSGTAFKQHFQYDLLLAVRNFLGFVTMQSRGLRSQERFHLAAVLLLPLETG